MPYEELHHTADWAIRVRAADLSLLFSDAARAMQALSGVKLAQGTSVRRTVQGQAADVESLLVSFLSELLFRTDHDGIGFSDLAVQVATSASESTFVAEVDEAPVDSIEKQIKAVTFHNLHVAREGDGYAVEIVFDV